MKMIHVFLNNSEPLPAGSMDYRYYPAIAA